mmetsp:Transcript_13723/g.12164  ORF Transcript_13723/g.12164 Transcript_13723/m.12164 type:complete len:103 (+) Transcript_13723:425-733(+)
MRRDISGEEVISIDGAYFGSGFPFALMQEYPDLRNTEESERFVPKLFGFKIFGHRGSKYFKEGIEKNTITYKKHFQEDEDGGTKTEDEIEKILLAKKTDAYD